MEKKAVYRRSDLAKLLGVGIATIDRWVASGKLPEKRKLSKKFTFWDKETIDNWLKRAGND